MKLMCYEKVEKNLYARTSNSYIYFFIFYKDLIVINNTVDLLFSNVRIILFKLKLYN